MIVVDASLALKWYLDEPHSKEAEDWFTENEGNILVPHVFIIEVTGALVRRANMEKRLRSESESSIARFVALFDNQLIEVEETYPHQMAKAATLAIDIGHPLKDCIYLVLAMELECELVTCDTRFASKARGIWDRVRVLGE